MRSLVFKKCEILPQSDEEWYIPKEALFANAILNAFEPEKRIALEVGVLHGAWSINVLRNAEGSAVTAVDPYPNMEGIRERTLERLEPFDFKLFKSWGDLEMDKLASLIHIDGLHTETAVFNDLKNAENYLDEKGVIIVDDCLQPVFPGVAAGWIKYLLQSDLCCFLCTGSKAYLTRKNDYDHWITSMRNALSQQKVIPWCNYLGENDETAYVSHPTIDGYKVLLSFERADPIAGDPILPIWPEQPVVPLLQPMVKSNKVRKQP